MGHPLKESFDVRMHSARALQARVSIVSNQNVVADNAHVFGSCQREFELCTIEDKWTNEAYILVFALSQCFNMRTDDNTLNIS